MIRALRRWLPGGGRAPAPIPEREWRVLERRVALLSRLPVARRRRLRALAAEFLERKHIEGAGGLELTRTMVLEIATQACLPLLGLDLDWYRGWTSVVVYPGDFLARHDYVDEAGVTHELEGALSGESWERGPVVLSLEGVRATATGAEWGNLVIHECAHKLDLLNGAPNGMPPLHSGVERALWTRTLSEAFEALRAERGRLDPDGIEHYAAEDPGEFFAVMSEGFFAHPDELDDAYPEVYDRLREFYRQDPLAWPQDG